jgi:hypothetical protein
MNTCDAQRDEMKKAAEEVRRAGEALLKQIIGGEAHAHLREARRHALRAARAAIDEAERRLDADAAKSEPAKTAAGA